MKFLHSEPPGLYTQSSQSFQKRKVAIPLLQLIPQTSANRYFYENGLSKLIPRLTLKVHSNIEECYLLWEKFSPKKSVFDLWDFRYSWYQGYQCIPYFYTLYEGKNPFAVLPLWFSREKKRFEWFGSNWMEDNTFFVKDDHHIDLLYAVMPSPIHINAIEKTSNWSKRLINKKLKIDDPKNVKMIAEFQSMEELLRCFNKKNRHRLKADFLHVSRLHPRIIETEGKGAGLIEQLISMNIEQFRNKPDDESDLVDFERAQTYRYMVQNAGVYSVKFIQIFIQNHLAGIDFVTTYKDRYYTMKGGIDINRFKGVSNFMMYYEFEEAMKKKFSLIDCLQIDYGWKHRFFDQTPTYLFEK